MSGTSGWGSVCVCVCVCVHRLSVSEAAGSPPGLSLITPLTPQEALDVVWLHNSLIELIWEIREGGVESVNLAPPPWNSAAAGPFLTCLAGTLLGSARREPRTLCADLLFVFVCL